MKKSSILNFTSMDLISEFKIKITKDDRLWLEALYNRVVNHETISYKVIRAELYERIPKDYDPNGIDDRLCGSKGTDLTLLAADVMHPEKEFIIKANTLVNELKAKILKLPETEHIELQEILDNTSLDHDEVDIILRLIRKYGRFYSGSSSSDSRITSITVREDEIFDNYIDFSSIEEVIRMSLEKQSKEKDSNLEYFTNYERKQIPNHLDELKEKLFRLEAGNEIIYDKIGEEFDALKRSLHLNKKDWSDKFFGALFRSISGNIMEKVLDVVSRIFKKEDLLSQ